MSKRVIIENQRLEKVEFGPLPPYVLTSIDLSGSEAEFSQTQGYMQDGFTPVSVTMKGMQYPLEFYIEAPHAKELFELRRKLNRVLHPKAGPFTVTVQMPHGIFQNTIIIENLPKYRVEDEQFLILQQGLFHITTSDPYWKNESDIEVPLLSWTPKFSFPFSCKPTVQFGYKGEQQKVINNGDEETPVKIEVFGPCTNPRVTNLTTMKGIQINRDILAGERLEINTAYGQNTVELVGIDGTKTNAYNWIAPGVRLNEFRLQVGLNIVDYSANAGRESATVRIRFRERYTGI
ncbi:phage tail domain-containing protein [Bacillus sp. FDAARGOS_1420]|uniref:phage distal tail protein n=1 Tax=Bacillus sp. FDAARGOS_1420 TaxID=2856338 RepID=UPI001C5B1DDA|nr:phage tail domain-containing protein [Bacillus sp. FDAARGOS_1420]MBW3491129.1 phage tail family protein [Bacillus sp. FDAARGOS_1420]